VTAATPTIASSAAANAAGPLTNLAHLDFLTDRVAVTDKAEHSTYRLAADPKVGVLWVYAKAGAHGKFARVGGGAYDPGGTPTGREPSTPTTSPAPPWCTCGNGEPPATRRRKTRPTNSFAD